MIRIQTVFEGPVGGFAPCRPICEQSVDRNLKPVFMVNGLSFVNRELFCIHVIRSIDFNQCLQTYFVCSENRNVNVTKIQ